MRIILLLILMAVSFSAMSQRGMVFIKKRGVQKVHTISEGEAVRFAKKDGSIVQGYLALVKSDSLLINGYWHRCADISRVLFRVDGANDFKKQFWYITAGVALSTAGITLAKWARFPKALAVSAGLGYGNFLIQVIPRLERKQYRIGKKFTLHPIDLHF
jgi:hypothetical protein